MKKIKHLLLFIIIPLICQTVFSQRNMMAGFVQERFVKTPPKQPEAPLLHTDPGFKHLLTEKTVSRCQYLLFDAKTAAGLIGSQPATLLLDVVNDLGETLRLKLVNTTDAYNETVVATASGTQFPVQKMAASHYRGIVQGAENSSVTAISIFENEITGIISTSEGNLVIGRLGNTGRHIVYNDKYLKGVSPVPCNMPNLPLSAAEKEWYNQSSASTARALLDRCVRLYYETEYDIYQNKGSVSGVVSYITGLHNQVSAIYFNEGIKTLLSQVFVWDVSDPYTGTSTELLLSEFQNTRFAFNGDLGQLVTFRNIGGGLAAGFNGLCNAGVNDKLSVTLLEPGFSTVPTYSLSVYISTHEFGHLFGSRHTHACVWNGNGTAIDGCSGFTEGGCALPGNPSGGGTIMSYCNNTSVGVNFNLGFGPQPGDIIRGRVTDATCLVICCKNDIVISGTYTKPITESGTWIVSSGTTTIPANTTVRLDAQPGTGYILLNPGFSTSATTVFSAQAYNGCTAGVPARINGKKEPEAITVSNAAMAEQAERGIRLYPNPASGIITINTTNTGETIKQLYIIGATGKILFQADNPEQINISRLNPGVYACRVETNMDTYSVKLIKQ